MTDVQEIRETLADRLEGLGVPDGSSKLLRVSIDIPEAVNPPMLVIGEDDPFIDYDMVLQRGADVFRFKLVLYVSKVVDRIGLQYLDGYRAGAGSYSVKETLEADWPDSPIHFATVSSAGAASRYTVGQIDYLGCEFLAEVVANG